MNRQRGQDPDKAQDARPGDLKASDFFPPGVGWNQAGGEQEKDDARGDQATREREGDDRRH